MNLTIDKQIVTLANFRDAWLSPVTAKLGDGAKQCIADSNKLIDNVVAGGEQVYGINTGFGQLAQIRISNDELVHLQENLVRSHAVGVGEDLGDDVVRLVMLMKKVVEAHQRHDRDMFDEFTEKVREMDGFPLWNNPDEDQIIVLVHNKVMVEMGRGVPN